MSSAFESCRTGDHTTSSLTTYRKQRDDAQQFGDLVHTALSIMVSPLKDFSSLSQRSDRSDVELHKFSTQRFANSLWRLKLKREQLPFEISSRWRA